VCSGLSTSQACLPLCVQGVRGEGKKKQPERLVILSAIHFSLSDNKIFYFERSSFCLENQIGTKWQQYDLKNKFGLL